ncbi:MAG: hypothetical protein WC256_02540 [Desulfurivibrionaceae bacterium]|jgi:hypothetical protein
MDISIILSIIGVLAGSFATVDKFFNLGKFILRKKAYEKIFILNNNIRHEFYKDLSKSKNDYINFHRKIILNDSDFKNVNNVKKAYEIYLDKDLKELKIKIKNTFHEEILFDYLNNTIEIKRDKTRKLFFNSGLISSLIQSYLSSTDKKSIDRNTIVGIMLGKKIDKYTKSFTCLFSGLGVHLLLVVLKMQQLSLPMVGILFLFIGALSLNQKMLEYRIKRGYYGTNGYEVKEIVQFIQSHSDKSDFIDKNGIKKLLPAPEEKIETELVVYGEAY